MRFSRVHWMKQCDQVQKWERRPEPGTRIKQMRATDEKFVFNSSDAVVRKWWATNHSAIWAFLYYILAMQVLVFQHCRFLPLVNRWKMFCSTLKWQLARSIHAFVFVKNLLLWNLLSRTMCQILRVCEVSLATCGLYCERSQTLDFFSSAGYSRSTWSVR